MFLARVRAAKGCRRCKAGDTPLIEKRRPKRSGAKTESRCFALPPYNTDPGLGVPATEGPDYVVISGVCHELV